MIQDEIETAAFVEEYPYLAGLHVDVMNRMVINNKRTTLRGFLLDENRPNFIGPRTFENQLAPGVTALNHTAYYWKQMSRDMWKRIQVRAKYEEFNILHNCDYKLWKGFLPWNWWRNSFDPNVIKNWVKGDLFDRIADKDDDVGVAGAGAGAE